jgi:hypothetical protein
MFNRSGSFFGYFGILEGERGVFFRGKNTPLSFGRVDKFDAAAAAVLFCVGECKKPRRSKTTTTFFAFAYTKNSSPLRSRAFVDAPALSPPKT